MTDLTTTPDTTPAKPTLPALSPALISLLDSDGTHDEAGRLAAKTPALRDELEVAYRRIEHDAKAKAGDDGVKAVIGKRFALYPQPQRSEGEWAAWWGEYYNLLSDLPLSSIEAAMRHWTALPDSEFLPKPGRLKEIAFSTPTRALKRLQRADAVLTYRPDPEHKPSTPEEREAAAKVDADIKRLLSETVNKLGGAHDPAKPKVRSNFASVDETGLSAGMRDLMARRYA